MKLVIVSLAVALVIVGALLAGPLLRRGRRQRLRRQSFPPRWAELIERRIELYRRIPADLKQMLYGHVRIFVAEKQFVGCDGVQVTDEMRLTVAAQACLLLMNDRSRVFDELETILIYPSAFLVDEEYEEEWGLRTVEQRALSGQSWDIRRLILSWEDAQLGGRGESDGYNVVLHEFAHQLDHESGAANGAPLLGGPAEQRRWADVMEREYERLCAQVERDQETLIDPYGATDPAEFFAVITETFFEQPVELAAEHPQLYACLADYYRVDPAAWWRSPQSVAVDQA